MHKTSHQLKVMCNKPSSIFKYYKSPLLTFCCNKTPPLITLLSPLLCQLNVPHHPFHINYFAHTSIDTWQSSNFSQKQNREDPL